MYCNPTDSIVDFPILTLQKRKNEYNNSSGFIKQIGIGQQRSEIAAGLDSCVFNCYNDILRLALDNVFKQKWFFLLNPGNFSLPGVFNGRFIAHQIIQTY